MPFRVRLDDYRLLPELVDTLRRAECEAHLVGGDVVVDVPRAPSSEQAEREIKIYLALWQAQHPETSTHFLADEGEG